MRFEKKSSRIKPVLCWATLVLFEGRGVLFWIVKHSLERLRIWRSYDKIDNGGVGGIFLDMEKIFPVFWGKGVGMGLGSGVEKNRKGVKGND